MQALMLAAGLGQRLGKYTEECTKCMIKVGGRTLLERVVEALRIAGIKKIILVVGWEHEKLIQYVRENFTGIEFEFVYNYDYASTNNIYSLYLAREQLAQDDTLLLESDLVFDKFLLKKMVEAPEENLVAVAKYEHWMDGTVTILSPEGNVQEFIEKKDFQFEFVERYFKTVNIYKFSREFSKQQYIPFLEAYIAAYGKNQYYELVLKALAHLSCAQLKAYILQDTLWYEIDDVQDLDIANTMFAEERDKLDQYEQHYGGYWRFPGLSDFCYLVNPYFPPKRMLDQIEYFYNPLLSQYPSGMSIQRLLVGKLFKMNEDYLLVGNGAAELINVLGQVMEGELSISVPAFNEYIRCFENCKITKLLTAENDFQLNKEQLMCAARTSDVLAIVNPDNPSGSFLNWVDLEAILDCCRDQGIYCIMDESFIDFVQSDQRYTLLDNSILERYPNLIVIKSICTSYGVPGLRLGVLATSNSTLLSRIKKHMPIWNINSFAEYFLQLFPLFADEYSLSCDIIAMQRMKFEKKLKQISFLTVYPSQTNFIMCRLAEPYKSKDIATQLLIKNNILIKDLSGKEGFSDKQYIRIAVKDEEENDRLFRALLELEHNV